MTNTPANQSIDEKELLDKTAMLLYRIPYASCGSKIKPVVRTKSKLLKQLITEECQKARTEVLEQLPITGIVESNGRRTEYVLAEEIYKAININKVISELKGGKV